MVIRCDQLWKKNNNKMINAVNAPASDLYVILHCMQLLSNMTQGDNWLHDAAY